MFDTMTITKVTGAVCGSLLVFLFGNWAADALYATGGGGHGEGGEQAYTIATEAAAGGETAVAEGPSFDELFAAADAGAGEKVFAKCKACHKVDGTNGTGPHLNGVVNRVAGTVEGFGYSEGMVAVAAPWDPAALNAFLTNPKGVVAGTKMAFAGLPKPEDRANLIAYLATLQ